MKKSIKLLALSLATLLSANGFAQTRTADIYKNIEFKMPTVAETSFPATSVSIKDFGAIAGTNVKNTDAFKKAMTSINQSGGGKVIVPRGIWMTGPIVLQSNVNLHLEDGAMIIFSRDFADYPLVDVNFESLKKTRCQVTISGKGATNIAIKGNGVIDGSGDE